MTSPEVFKQPLGSAVRVPAVNQEVLGTAALSCRAFGGLGIGTFIKLRAHPDTIIPLESEVSATNLSR